MALFYTDIFNGGDTSGWHQFDAAVLADIKTTFDLIEEAHAQTDPSGEAIRVRRRTAGRAIICERMVVHRNGRVGTRDLTKDTITIDIGSLRIMSEAIQTMLYDYEQTPSGLGKRRPNVTRPPRV